jgi:penicillin-binding protein 1A
MGEGETGGKAAAPIWGAFMKTVLKDTPVKEYQPPSSVEFRKIDARTGLVSASGGFVEAFKKGSTPTAPEPRLIKGSRWDNYGADLDQF